MRGIAKLRHQVELQQLVSASDGQGGVSSNWDFVAKIWCDLKPTKSYERYFANQIQYQRTHEAIIRHRTDVTNSMRLKFDGRYFQIKGVRRPDERKFYLVLDLEENQGT